MAREKTYTRTIAVRVTDEEWDLILFELERKGWTKPTQWMRHVITGRLALTAIDRKDALKKAEAKAKRDAKKAANGDTKPA